MNILFLTLVSFENFNTSGIYPDFIKEIANRGHDIYVVSPREKRYNKKTELVEKSVKKVVRLLTDVAVQPINAMLEKKAQ